MSESTMARRQKTDLATLDQQLSAEAGAIATMVSQGSSPRISMDRNGRFTAPDGLDLGTEIRGVVVDFISKNQFYTSTYDPNNPQPPVCFAMDKVLGDMAPHEEAPDPQADACASCPHNQWGSRGRGKACKNTRELAFILEEDMENPEPSLYLISVPPTGIASFDAFANLCGRVLDAPPIKAVVTIKSVQKGQYSTMAFVDPDNNPNYAEHFGLRDEAMALISRTPDLSNYQPTRRR